METQTLSLRPRCLRGGDGGQNIVGPVPSDAERRIWRRRHYRPKILFIHCRLGTFRSHDGRMVNYSRGGLCFESKIQLDPGTHFYIQLGDTRPQERECIAQGLKRVALATVVWCRDLAGAKGRYRIGAKYRFASRAAL